MFPRSFAGLMFALGGALFTAFLLWILYWKDKILFDPKTRDLVRAGKRPPGFFKLGGLPEAIYKPAGLVVFLTLILSVVLIAGALLLLAVGIQSGRSGLYSLQVTPVPFWLQMGRWSLMLLAGVAMFWWATWILATEERDRVRLTQRTFQRLDEGMDNLAGKRKFVWVLYVIAISVGLLMVARSITSGRVIGWTPLSQASHPFDFWAAIGIWLGITGWIGARFLQELRSYWRAPTAGK